MTTQTHAVAETAIELTLCLSAFPAYGEWHDAVKHDDAGHASVVTMLADLAEQIERVVGGWDYYDWYLTVDAISAALIQRTTATLTDDEVRALLTN